VPTLRIYADFNGLAQGPKNAQRTAVVLDTFGSLRDLANAGIILKKGFELIAFDASDETEDLEGHGTAEFDEERGRWVVEFDAQGVRYVPAGDRTQTSEFNCVSCRKPLAELIAANGLNLGDRCPSCSTEIHAPISPPTK